MVLKPAIFSASLGQASLHGFDHKIQRAANAGFQAIELFYPDLEHEAIRLSNSEKPSDDNLLVAADHVYQICQAHNIDIITLQPFMFYDGLIDRTQHARMLDKMRLWLRLAARLHTDTIGVPANFVTPNTQNPDDTITGNRDVIAADLREICDLGLARSPVVRFAYENLCWSTHINTWEAVWDIVKRVDRPNFGMCLDTFNIAGGVWADPTSLTGKVEEHDADQALRQSLERFVKEVDVKKVFLLQVVDAERLDSPLVAGHPFHVEGQPALMSWSRNARAFMYEETAYLPTEDITKAVISELGYRGHVSLELFSRTTAEEGEKVADEHAQRGMSSWKKLRDILRLQ